MDELNVRQRFEAELPDGWQFDARDLALLATAEKIAARIDELEAELRQTGLTVTGSQGQPRLSPLVPEIRLQQSALARVLEAVHVPAEPGEVRKSSRHQRAARARWDREERANG